MSNLDVWIAPLNLALLAADEPAAAPSFLGGPALMLICFALFFVMVLRPQRREQQKRQAMLSNLKKNDRILTNFGMYGVVASIRPEKDQVSIKVDESSNVEMKMALSAIARVIVDEPPKTPPAA